ncbi:MAG TPA: radical SAM protein [Candidatus Polarisedimenticolia bacterium]|jgi:7-carboxy-7-deazaguanine synthase|nr:radical SAM protein [Candidatus Polarisedimenticolia bacterium]
MTSPAPSLRITEIFHSIQGESTQAGRRCSFVRLTGCNLRCVWCDTAYAFEGGADVTISDIVRQVESHRTELVLVTGGEPLAQEAVHDLMGTLLEAGKEVMIETGGSLALSRVDPRVRIIMDVKCPGSGMERMNRWENLSLLKPTDEIKFVVSDRGDYEWARKAIRERRLAESSTILLSPVFGVMDPRRLAEWILEDALEVRMQVQLHKWIWPPEMRGV